MMKYPRTRGSSASPDRRSSQASRSTRLRQLVFGGDHLATTLVSGGAVADVSSVEKYPNAAGE